MRRLIECALVWAIVAFLVITRPAAGEMCSLKTQTELAKCQNKLSLCDTWAHDEEKEIAVLKQNNQALGKRLSDVSPSTIPGWMIGLAGVATGFIVGGIVWGTKR